MIDIILLKVNIISFLIASKMALMISTFAFLIGIFIGFLLALMILSENSFIRLIANSYVVIIRGTPMLIHIMGLFFILPLWGINIENYFIAIIAIGMNSGAYMSQVIKSGFSTVEKGQKEAARTLGFSKWQIFRLIIMPQVLRIIFPMIKNESITLIKDSSLASIIGVIEISQQGTIITNMTYDAITAYVGVAITYLVLTSLASLFFYILEKRIFYVNN